MDRIPKRGQVFSQWRVYPYGMGRYSAEGSRWDTLLFRGTNQKQGTRQTYSVNEVEGIVDIDTGEFTEIHEWLHKITRGRVGG